MANKISRLVQIVPSSLEFSQGEEKAARVYSHIRGLCERRCQQIKRPKREGYKAFTLIELLIAIAVFSIILFTISASMSDFVEKNRSLSSIQNIAAGITMARNEAIIRGQSVMFCASDDGMVCGGLWNNGQLIIDAKKNVVRLFARINNNDTLSWKSSLSDDKNDYLEFLPTGETNAEQGSFYYCPNGSTKNAYAIIVQQSGFFRISDKTAEGKDIICD